MSVFILAGTNWSTIQSTECEDCKAERKKKCRVLDHQSSHAKLLEEPFLSAVCIFSYNDPKYHSIMLRVSDYAERKGQSVTWYFAHDVPLFSEDRDLELCKLDAKRYAWLARHDQDTSHLSSLLPLMVGLPMRLTETIDRDRRLYKGQFA